MAYVDQELGKRRTVAIGSVIVIHAVLGMVVATGLAPPIFTLPEDRPFEGFIIPEEKPPPPPPPEQATPPDPIDSVITVPEPIIELPTLNPPLIPVQPPIIDPGPAVPFVPTITQGPVTPTPAYQPRSPRPRNDRNSWVLKRDYPHRDLVEGNQGTTRVELAVGVNGRVSECRVIASSGHASLDSRACERIASKARFEPATNELGEKVAGTYRSSVTWQIPE